MSDSTLSRRDFIQQSGGCAIAALTAAAFTTTVAGQAAGPERRYPMPLNDGASIDREAQVILVRSQNRVCALLLACPHEQAAVRWVDKDKRFQCTKHDSKYQPDGVYISGRATRSLDRFAIRLDGTSIFVNLDRVFQSDKDRAAWDAAVVVIPAGSENPALR
jgi:nitrite reductase/ring-hydroxylating ferredoxin subunit